MKHVIKAALAVGVAGVIGAIYLPESSTGQPAPAPAVSPAAQTAPRINEAELLQLLTEIKAQQATARANQEKIEAQVAAIQEDVRQARIFAARGGGRSGVNP